MVWAAAAVGPSFDLTIFGALGSRIVLGASLARGVRNLAATTDIFLEFVCSHGTFDTYKWDMGIYPGFMEMGLTLQLKRGGFDIGLSGESRSVGPQPLSTRWATKRSDTTH